MEKELNQRGPGNPFKQNKAQGGDKEGNFVQSKQMMFGQDKKLAPSAIFEQRNAYGMMRPSQGAAYDEPAMIPPGADPHSMDYFQPLQMDRE